MVTPRGPGSSRDTPRSRSPPTLCSCRRSFRVTPLRARSPVTGTVRPPSQCARRVRHKTKKTTGHRVLQTLVGPTDLFTTSLTPSTVVDSSHVGASCLFSVWLLRTRPQTSIGPDRYTYSCPLLPLVRGLTLPYPAGTDTQTWEDSRKTPGFSYRNSGVSRVPSRPTTVVQREPPLSFHHPLSTRPCPSSLVRTPVARWDLEWFRNPGSTSPRSPRGPRTVGTPGVALPPSV